MLTALFHGIILAFGLILPLGVQNVFIFNQGATHRKFSRALPAVVTAGICDMLLILLAVMGVSLIVFSFAWLKNLIFLVGFVFMVYMGWSIFKSAPGSGKGRREALSPKQQILFAASVSLLNPHAILDLIGVIGPSSLAYEGEQLVVFTVACISVSFLWFFGLAIAGRLIGGFDTDGKIIRRLNQISAFIIWGIAAYLGIQLVESL
ncbi:lysine transporter LysE [Bhargavaea cecembensis]|uniref:Lysine transporter LysE n=1 Tax=Bhargavaea cecembensis TaxID=394098 RepID=A0A163EFF4_9BACL|nr:LysE/ArgO family amino acid transporter [Bhargavaea cecembensis]KZE36391.1 lysine transporter LysE [Bhargavaea cecembensis]